MEIFFGIFSSLIPIAIIAGIIAAIVALVRRRREEEAEPGIGTLRRLFFYGLSLAGLIPAGIGVVLLLSAVLNTLFGPQVIAGGETALPLGLALTLVGTPVWLIFWRITQRSVQRFPVETRAASRKIYIYFILAGSAITVSIASISFLRWVLGTSEFSGPPLSLVAVYSGVWAFHWLLERREGQASDLTVSIRRVYGYGLSLFGLVVLALGIGYFLRNTLGAAYESLLGAPELLVGEPLGLWNEVTRTSLAMALVGGGMWWWHWFRVVRADFDSALRRIYLYLFAVLGGALTVVISLSVLFYHILQWFFGSPEITSPLVHFDVLPRVIATATVGAGLWTYHWAVVRQEVASAQRQLVGARRVYGYLVSAIGLVTLGVGLVNVFAVVLGLLSSPGVQIVRDNGWWRNPLVLAITLLVVGVPVWGLYWRDMQRIAVQGGAVERGALSRRVFIFLIFGVSIVLTLINLSIVLFELFDAAIGGTFSADLLWEIRWSTGILLMAGAVSVYYWLVLREDREVMALLGEAGVEEAVAAPAAVRPRKSVTALVSEQGLSLIRRLEARLGYGIQVWRQVGVQGSVPSVSDEHLAEAAQRIADADSDHAFLLVDAEGIQVLPFRQ